MMDLDICKVDNHLLLKCTVDRFLIECVGQDLTYSVWLDLNSYKLLKEDE